RWHEVEACCAARPRRRVHADFLIKELRVRAGLTGLELLVFDWELAHWGVPATDLAQIVGRTASPDLNVYGSAVQRDFGGLDARDIQRLADCGKLLRVVDELYWATTFIGGSSYKFLVGPGGAVSIAKRCPAATAKVERMIYEEFLARVPVPSLHCHGFLEEPDSELCWLFLEEAPGVMYSPQRGDHRALAARWLGTVHC